MAARLCRVCLRTNRLRPLFARRKHELLARLADLTITENDGLPQSICVDCTRNVRRALELRTLCRSSDAKLRNLLKLKQNVTTDHSSSELNDTTIHDSSSNNRLAQSSGSEQKYTDSNFEAVHSFNSIKRSSRESGSAFDSAQTVEDSTRTDELATRKINICTNEIEHGDKSDHPTRCVANTGTVRSACRNEFDGRPEPTRHVEPVHKHAFSCDVCNKFFSQKQGFSRHMKLHEKNTNSTLCTFCGKAFVRSDSLKRHIRTHTGERPYSCELCSKKFKQSSELKEHVKTHSDTKSYICSECGKGLASRNGLYNHMKIHKGEKMHKCKLCGNEFITNGELNSHIKHIHSFQKPYECTLDGCSKAFASRLSLKIHIQAHNGDKPFKCSICEKSLATSSSLHEHKKIHTGEFVETCTICNKRLGNLKSLKKHMRIHSGEKPYECVICFEKFINPTTLKYHIKTNHTEEKYECTNCPEKFEFATKFRQHNLDICVLSNNVKSYSCNICSSVFNQISKLHHHMKIHKNEKQINEHNIRIDNIAPLIPIDQISTPQSLISHYL